MHRSFVPAALAALLLFGTASAVHAHGDIGNHVANFQAHLGDYEQEVNDMVARLDRISGDYVAGDDVSDRVDALVGRWEKMHFHEAVETEAITLYPPIWVALGGYKQAVSEDAPDADISRWQQRIEAALWQGMGALKLAAKRAAKRAEGSTASASAGTSAPVDDNRAPVAAIKHNLEQVRSTYREGDVAAAKELLQQTYMQRFEGIEGDLIERDADLVTSLEEAFNATLPLLMDKNAPAEKIDARVETMNAKLDRARSLLDEAGGEQSSVF